MLFEVERTTVSGRPALTVRGELDLSTVPELASAVEAQIAAAPRAFVIDLLELERLVPIVESPAELTTPVIEHDGRP